MTEFEFTQWLWLWLLIGIITFFAALRYKAAYGRHISDDWGPQIDNMWGWFFMELPAVVIPTVFLFYHVRSLGVIHVVILSLFILHYFNRVFIFPFRLKTSGKKIPLVIALFALLFNLINGYNIGYYFTSGLPLTQDWFYDFRFIIGLAIFFLGMYINHRSDTILIHLRQPGETAYKIPKGFLFEKISCPNHFGEIIEWIGFAILSWSLPALAFAIWTMANLIPRALNHHKWYAEKFPDYPTSRKAVIPYLV